MDLRSYYMSIALVSCKKKIILCGKIILWCLGNSQKSRDLFHFEIFTTVEPAQQLEAVCKLGLDLRHTSSEWKAKEAEPRAENVMRREHFRAAKAAWEEEKSTGKN
jgi:hypothetical protein